MLEVSRLSSVWEESHLGGKLFGRKPVLEVSRLSSVEEFCVGGIPCWRNPIWEVTRLGGNPCWRYPI